MQYLRYLRRPSRRVLHHHHCRHFHASNDTTASSSVVASIKWVRDRGLDHAVEKERDLKPMVNVKNLINSEPSKSLPLAIISGKRSSLGIPIRPIDFIRKYPSVFQEFLPGGIGIHPHIKLTPETLTLDAQEQLLFQSQIHKQDVATRLLKLLMIARINKIPLSVIDRFKWDLGLPHDYTQTLVPEFPDYFQVTSNGTELELVCWSKNLAVSKMETSSISGSEIVFPLQYSREFELDKKFKKWVDNWQKLPYISPYENAFDLQAKSDASDKWTVAILHELLHLLVPKKTDKDNLLFLGEYLGVRSRFKRALLQHPGIFYVSSKLNTHTVVLREAYKRDLLVSKPGHPLMSLRSKYLHLMNMVKAENKSKNTQVVGLKKPKPAQDSKEGEDDELSEHEGDEMASSLSELEDSDSENDDIESDKLVMDGRTPTRRHRTRDEEDEEKTRGRTSRRVKFDDSPRRNTPNSRGSENDGRRRGSRKKTFEEKMNSGDTKRPRFLRTEAPDARNVHGRSSERSSHRRTREGRL